MYLQRLVISFFVALNSLSQKKTFIDCETAFTNQERVLIKSIMKNYNKRHRPVKSHKDTLQLKFDIALKQIINVDERNQLLKVNAWVRQYWRDYHLRWNESEYDGLQSIEIDASEIWLPDITLANNAQEQFYGFDKATKNRVTVYWDGSVVWLTPVILKAECRIDIRHFPFDKQDCPLHFMSWAMDGKKLNISACGFQGDASNTSPNGEWLLEDFGMKRIVEKYKCCPNPYPSLVYRIRIRRRSLFYIFNLIVPSILLSFLAITSFFVPAESGERTSLVITNLLTLTVFMLIISSSIPATSEVIPIIGKFLTTILVLMGMALAVTCFIIRYSFKVEEPPFFVKNYINKHLAKMLCFRPAKEEVHAVDKEIYNLQKEDHKVVLKKFILNNSTEEDHPNEAQDSKPPETKSLPLALKDNEFEETVVRELHELTRRAKIENEKERKSSEWKRMSSVLDRFFSILFLLMIVAANVWLFVAPPQIAL